MLAKLKNHGRHIAASYLRAVVATVGAIQLTNWGDLRGVAGALQGALVATVPPILVAVTAIAKDLDGD